MFTLPKSALRHAPFYAGLLVTVWRSSPATSSKYMAILEEMQGLSWRVPII